jgi:hypothetical protein
LANAPKIGLCNSTITHACLALVFGNEGGGALSV